MFSIYHKLEISESENKKLESETEISEKNVQKKRKKCAKNVQIICKICAKNVKMNVKKFLKFHFLFLKISETLCSLFSYVLYTCRIYV